MAEYDWSEGHQSVRDAKRAKVREEMAGQGWFPEWVTWDTTRTYRTGCMTCGCRVLDKDIHRSVCAWPKNEGQDETG